jgi:hypothetical protein
MFASIPAKEGESGPPAKRGLKDLGVDDLVMLTKISEDAITENLKKRLANEYIYVSLPPKLFSCFSSLPLLNQPSHP